MATKKEPLDIVEGVTRAVSRGIWAEAGKAGRARNGDSSPRRRRSLSNLN